VWPTALIWFGKETGVNTKKLIKDFAVPLIWALVLAAVLRAGVVQASWVPSGSMEPALLVGDHMLVNKLRYDLKLPFTDYVLFTVGSPQRGDVVVFKNPTGSGSDYVKRIIGLPGETVEVGQRKVFVNGHAISDPWARHLGGPGTGSRFGPVAVPAGNYFMMGDNRDNSHDSRFWNHGRGGFVPRSDLVGRAEMVLWSWREFPVSLRWQRLGHVIQ
jgi:signal peptidase I